MSVKASTSEGASDATHQHGLDNPFALSEAFARFHCASSYRLIPLIVRVLRTTFPEYAEHAAIPVGSWKNQLLRSERFPQSRASSVPNSQVVAKVHRPCLGG